MTTPWNPEESQLGVTKPRALAWLETQGNDVLNAMDDREADKRIQDAGQQLAKNYVNEQKGDYEGCKLTVSTALSVAGNSIGGKIGALMVAMSDEVAEKSCRRMYPNDLTGEINGRMDITES